MRRALFTLAAGASAVLCVAVGVLWVRSHRAVDDVYHAAWEQPAERTSGYDRRVYHGLRSDPDGLTAYRRADAVGPMVFANREGIFLRGGRDGFYLSTKQLGPDGRLPETIILHPLEIDPDLTFRSINIRCPYWLLAAGTCVLPAVWAVTRRRAARAAKRGLCPACGYDLRATPNRCPECGTAARQVA